jgi:cytosine deaminase
MQMFDKVTASHTTAMHSYNNAYVLKLMRLLKLSRINFVSNPLVNIHLGGRADAYPIRRGVTRIKELTENGLNVSFGNDDIFDPWYPMGNGNMRDVVCQGLNISHMMGYEDICNGYRFVTENAAKTLHITDHYGVEEGKPANMIVLDAPDYYDALNNDSALLYSVRGGRIIVKGRPAETQILTD